MILNRTVSALNDDLDQIKQQLLSDFEDGVSIDIAAWTKRFPAHREELLDYWMWLSGTPLLREMDMGQSPGADDKIAQEAVRRACLAVSTNPPGREARQDPEFKEDRDLGAELALLRAALSPYVGSASKEFRRAVVYAWIVHILSPQRPRVTRLATQKVAYLLEEAIGLGLFTEHERKPLGPYDHTAKYRDAEPIAQKGGWIQVKGASLEPKKVDAKFEGYFRRYVRSEGLVRRFITRLAKLTDEELEAWATIAWAGQALVAAGKPVTADSVRGFLESSAIWRSKLRRDNFTADRIADALAKLSLLRLV